MRFEKKMIILNGDGKAKGTLSLEKNAYGSFATLNVYNLPELQKGGFYSVGIKTPDAVFTKELGNKGHILARFVVNDFNLSLIHAVVFANSDDTALLYGTTTNTPLWPANRMDGFRNAVKQHIETQQAQEKQATTIEGERFTYSKNPNADVVQSPKNTAQQKDIREYFFDIVSPTSTEKPTSEKQIKVENVAPIAIEEQEKETEKDDLVSQEEHFKSLLSDLDSDYNDMAVASSNYYTGNNGQITLPRIYSGRDSVDLSDVNNPVDQYFIDNASNELPHSLTEITPVDECGNFNNDFINNANSNAVNSNNNTNYNQSLKEVAFTVASVANSAPIVPPINNCSAEKATNFKPNLVFSEQMMLKLEELFNSYERFDTLEQLMPDTKWVKVDFDAEKYYVVGTIGRSPDYICYGVPSNYSEFPPAELGTDAKWMPENPQNPKTKGFWLMFQDAISGEAV